MGRGRWRRASARPAVSARRRRARRSLRAARPLPARPCRGSSTAARRGGGGTSSRTGPAGGSRRSGHVADRQRAVLQQLERALHAHLGDVGAEAGVADLGEERWSWRREVASRRATWSSSRSCGYSLLDDLLRLLEERASALDRSVSHRPPPGSVHVRTDAYAPLHCVRGHCGDRADQARRRLPLALTWRKPLTPVASCRPLLPAASRSVMFKRQTALDAAGTGRDAG